MAICINMVAPFTTLVASSFAPPASAPRMYWATGIEFGISRIRKPRSSLSRRAEKLSSSVEVIKPLGTLARENSGGTSRFPFLPSQFSVASSSIRPSSSKYSWVFIRAPRVTAPAMESLERSAKYNMSPAHNGFVLGDRFFRTIPNMHPRVHVRRAAEIPQHRRPFDLPHIPHAILADVHSFVVEKRHGKLIDPAGFVDQRQRLIHIHLAERRQHVGHHLPHQLLLIA